MADATQQARETQQKSAELKARSVEEAYAHHGTPTPTQEECDLAKLGVALDEHQDDGSGPSPHIETVIERNSEAQKPAGGYQTRNHEPTKEKENQRPASSSQHPTTTREAPKS